jgi:hypothetical protein
MTEQPKSWRDVIKVHPAADLFPMMTADELKALGEDIKKNGLGVPLILWEAEKGAPLLLLDGRNRLDASEAVGLPVLDQKGKWLDCRIRCDLVRGGDPYEYVLCYNVHRRHLTPEQKRDLIAKVLKAQPSKSNRTVAKQTKTDHKTVGTVRDKLEAGGEIPHHDVHEDARGTNQPARKPPTKKKRRTEDDYLAEKKVRLAATKDAEAPAPGPQQTDLEDCIAEKKARNPPDSPLIAAWRMSSQDQKREFAEAWGDEAMRLLRSTSPPTVKYYIYDYCKWIELGLDELDERDRKSEAEQFLEEYREIEAHLEELRDRLDDVLDKDENEDNADDAVTVSAR